MASWNLASVWDGIAATDPDRAVRRGGDGVVTWGTFSDRATQLAYHLHAVVALEPGDRIAIALPNCLEYLETFYAALKLGCVPVNVDVAYGANEVKDILDHSDAKAMVHAPANAKVVRTATKRIPKPWRPVVLATGAPYEAAIAGAPPHGDWPLGSADRDEVALVYANDRDDVTRAAMLRNDGLQTALSGWITYADATTVVVLAPFTAPAGMFTALAALADGQAIAFLEDEGFDPGVVWDAVSRERVDVLAAVTAEAGDSLLDASAATPERWNLGGLRTVIQSGAWSTRTKRQLATQFPTVVIREDPFAAMTAVSAVRTRSVVAAPAPIMTGGSAVSAPHVEVTLRKHASVVDCVVVGVPDVRAGEWVVALVQVADNHYLDEAELTAWCRSKLRASETPRRFLFVAHIDWSDGDGANRARTTRRTAISRLAGPAG